jgi:alkaline phosphatase
MNEGRTAYVFNDTQDNLVPESAAAATQMATGVKVLNKSISIGDQGKQLKTILEVAREKGKATDLVTTSRITDATPAAFAAHGRNRSDEYAIAEQLLQSDVTILFGGGRAFFLPEGEKGSKRKDKRNLLEEAKKRNYVVIESADAMRKAKGKNLLGLFSGSNMLPEADRSGSNEPSLAQMTSKALDALSGNKEGFFLMIEGGGIDYAAHNNDIAALILEGIAFDEAVKVAYEFQKRNTDTLLIITGDHETGGLSLLSYSLKNQEIEGNGVSNYMSACQPQARWATKSHSAAPLFVWGIGPGSEKINGWKHNTEIFNIMVKAYGF